MQIFKFFNSLESKLSEFHPLKSPSVLLYTCGPTVYNFAHIGNFRTYIFEDILKRSLEYFDYTVKHVMNITDIDDKTIKGAIENEISLSSFTEPFTKAFFEDLHALNIIKANFYPKATDYVGQMITMIGRLIDARHAYRGPDGSIYFSITSFPKYGRLSNLDQKELKAGASQRVESDEYDKESPSDFALWKAYDEMRDGLIFWDSPFGKGRPGWHIECSAMATDILGQSIDIHCGGIDNMFPHHENEIAQCEACSGKTFSNFWLHSQHLLVDGKKMSKSLGNFYTLRDLMAKGYNARSIRFVLAVSHYRMPLNFTFAGLDGAKAALQRIDGVIKRLNEQSGSNERNINLEDFKKDFEDAILEDLNMPLALSAVFDMIRFINSELDIEEISQEAARKILDLFLNFDRVLGFLFHKTAEIPEFIMQMAQLRYAAKKMKKFQEADRLRDEIKNHGFIVEDTQAGFRVLNI